MGYEKLTFFSNSRYRKCWEQTCSFSLVGSRSSFPDPRKANLHKCIDNLLALIYEGNSLSPFIFLLSYPASRLREALKDFRFTDGSFDNGDPNTTNLYLGNLNPKVSNAISIKNIGAAHKLIRRSIIPFVRLAFRSQSSSWWKYLGSMARWLV